MRKKAILKLNFVISAILIMAILIVFSYFFVKSNWKSVKVNIDSTTSDIELESFLAVYLKTPIGNSTISDNIIYYYLNGDPGKILEETNKIIESTFGSKARWQLDVEGKILKNYNVLKSIPKSIEFSLPLFSDSTKKSIKVRLSLGYEK